MTYCGERAIPHSVFLGRVVEQDESQWLPQDRAKALAWLADKSERCPGCGTAPWEWDPERGGSKTAYVPEKQTCEGCNRKEHARENEDPKGTYVILVPQSVHTERELRRQYEREKV